MQPTEVNAHEGVKAKPSFLDVDFDRSPFVVAWELTRACDLVCRHCRASAKPKRDPAELNTEESFRLIDQLREFGRPLLVLTGGDPFKRQDLFDLVERASQANFRVALTPSGTPLVTLEGVAELKRRGLDRLAVSLDGSTAEIHDRFRNWSGSFDCTMRIFDYAREVGVPSQVNTTVTRYNLDDFDAMAELTTKLGIAMWSVFLLVPTGRGKKKDEISAAEYEQVFNKLYDLSKVVPFDIKSTAAPHFRRVVLQRKWAEGGREGAVQPEAGEFLTGPGFATSNKIGRAMKGVNDGNGFVFVSHVGEVMPSGFLPIDCGNIRDESIVDIYRNHPVFVDLRDYDKIKGKCGWCEFKWICGGSRSRAYAFTGDYMASEPFCVYLPKKPEGTNDIQLTPGPLEGCINGARKDR